MFKPITLPWIEACAEASYPLNERWEIVQAAMAYLGWLDSLPEVGGTK